VTERQTQTAAYWNAAFTIEEADLEYLYNLLLEDETPLTTDEMALAIIRRRCDLEAQALKRQEQGASVYLPKETYPVGQRLVFPALQFATGTVVSLRPVHSPEHGEFEVIAVEFGNGNRQREFATRLPDHKLNFPLAGPGVDELRSPEALFAEYGSEIASKLEARLQRNLDIVRIAGRWFPRALLATINIGHLNLAEAVLDMAGGGPLPGEVLVKEVELPNTINPRLQAFSLNYALQEDARFDEVGPAGQVLWHLHRLEPPEVIFPPRRLENAAPDYDLSKLTPTLRALALELEDEFSAPPESVPPVDEVEVTLTFPHRRVGTLPLSPRLSKLFPTAYKSARIRFLLVDGESGEKFPGWVVRAGRYVYGLDQWYEKHEIPAGGHLTVKPGDVPGEIKVKAATRRPAREWVRTAVPRLDGGLSFAMQKRPIAVAYDDLMIVAVDNLAAVDAVWLKSQSWPFHRLVADVFRELAKLNPQSAVHAKTLYAAVNVARRSPPEPIFAELVSHPYYAHVGDAYWRFDQTAWTE